MHLLRCQVYYRDAPINGSLLRQGCTYSSINFTVEVEDYSKDSSLQLYQDLFEGPFLVETGGHYRKESAKLVAELTCSEYLHQVVAKLQVAKRQGDVFLHQSSITKVSCCAVS